MKMFKASMEKAKGFRAAVLFMSLALLLVPSLTGAQRLAGVERPESIQLVMGKSLVLSSGKEVKRISVADPEVADIVLLSPRQIYLTGKASGATNLTLWDKTDRVLKIYDLSVSPDYSRLKVLIHQVLPDEADIKVIPAHDSVTLAGTVSSPENLGRALAIAETFAPEKVVNLMQIGGVQQVLLEVKVAEMSRTVLKQLGFNLTYLMKDGTFLYTFMNNLVELNNLTGPLPLSPLANMGNLEISQSVNGMFRAINGENVLTGFLDALKQDGLVKILAEPNLICLSGQEADFLAGGEIPVPIPQGLGTVAIEYKKYGVSLKFKPTVLGEGLINVDVSPEVSELDPTNGVNIENFIIPALTTRKASTSVELRDGQSFAIAGLLKDTVRNTIDKYPVLGELPVLGMLFRSTAFNKSETELIIIVTPRLAKPLDMAKQTLPTDNYVEPNDAELYLLGLLEGGVLGGDSEPVAKQAPAAKDPESGFDGRFGHTLPAQ